MAEYINREEILMELAEAYDEIDPRFSRGRAIKEAIVIIKNRINAIPAAEVAPVVHGKWMKEDKGFGRDITTLHLMHVYKYICPLCGYNTDNQASRFNFCPNCGARMNGEE